MKKTVSAVVFAALTVCAAPAFYASAAAAATAKPAVAKKAPAVKAKAVAASGRSASSTYWQCVTFARSLTGLEIFGDAWTWWTQGSKKYETGKTPRPGAVMVFPKQGKMGRGHVAVVSQIITERYIQITHANWSPVNGRRGQVEKDVNVMDVSEKGDWSKVKVWYGPLNDFGTSVYQTNGFIYQDTVEGQARARQLIAEADDMPKAPVPYQQVAMATPVVEAELPPALRDALTPGNDQGFLKVKANTVAATVTGADATALTARVEADKAVAAAAAPAPTKPAQSRP